jgi:hypothetical protein
VARNNYRWLWSLKSSLQDVGQAHCVQTFCPNNTELTTADVARVWTNAFGSWLWRAPVSGAIPQQSVLCRSDTANKGVETDDAPTSLLLFLDAQLALSKSAAMR